MLKKKEESYRVVFWSYTLFLIVFCFIFTYKYPQDDYWRHLASAFYNFDYSKIYINTYLPSVNCYIGYDIFLSYLYKVFGVYSFVFIQILIIILYSIGFYKKTKNTEYLHVSLLVFIIVIYFLIPRIISARPALFASSLFFLIWCFDEENTKRRIVIAMLYSLFSPFYWLNFIFIIPLVLFRSRIYLITLFSFCGFWFYYSGLYAYIDIVWHHLTVFKYRPFQISESLSGLFVFLSFFLLVLYLVKGYIAKDKGDFLATIYFICTFQIRYYLDILIPLMSLNIRFLDREKMSKGLSLALIIAVLMLTIQYKDDPIKKIKETCYRCNELENKRILFGGLYEITFYLTYYVKNIKVTPPMEIAWTDEKIKNAMKKLKNTKTFDCSILKEYEYDYVIEDTLNYVPECLELSGWAHRYRIWKVKK